MATPDRPVTSTEILKALKAKASDIGSIDAVHSYCAGYLAETVAAALNSDSPQKYLSNLRASLLKNSEP